MKVVSEHICDMQGWGWCKYSPGPSINEVSCYIGRNCTGTIAGVTQVDRPRLLSFSRRLGETSLGQSIVGLKIVDSLTN